MSFNSNTIKSNLRERFKSITVKDTSYGVYCVLVSDEEDEDVLLKGQEKLLLNAILAVVSGFSTIGHEAVLEAGAAPNLEKLHDDLEFTFIPREKTRGICKRYTIRGVEMRGFLLGYRIWLKRNELMYRREEERYIPDYDGGWDFLGGYDLHKRN